MYRGAVGKRVIPCSSGETGFVLIIKWECFSQSHAKTLVSCQAPSMPSTARRFVHMSTQNLLRASVDLSSFTL